MDRIYPYMASAMMAFLPATASVAQTQSDWHWGHPGWGFGWGHMMFGGLMMIIFWGGIILLIVLLVRWFGGASFSGTESATPLEILKKRYAKGEIDKKEYDERKKVLSE